MHAPKQVLIIDPDQTCSGSFAALLAMAGSYQVTEVATAMAADDAFATAGLEFSAVVMDIDAVDGSGLRECIRLRQRHTEIVIILTTSSSDEMLLVKGLAAGADDFVRKPFRASEMIARLEARLRRLAMRAEAAVSIGRFEFHPYKRLLVDHSRNSSIRLAEKEAKLLWHLYLGNGDVVSRVGLLHAIWGYHRTAASHTVETHVYRLRQKIETDPNRPAIVVTERGGYRFVSQKDGGAAPLSFSLRPYVTRFAV